MTKRLLHVGFLFFYLVSSSGACINMHFCCGHLVHWSLSGEAEKCGSGKDGNKKCCKDVCLTLNQTDNHQGQTIVEAPSAPKIYNPTIFLNPETIAPPFPDGVLVLSPIHAPPIRGKSSLNVMYQVFRI